MRATALRIPSSVVKYIPLPRPLRIAEGTAPRHSVCMGLGPERMARRLFRRVEDWDCCTRVLRRSAGCRIIAETVPPARPDAKCL